MEHNVCSFLKPISYRYICSVARAKVQKFKMAAKMAPINTKFHICYVFLFFSVKTLYN